MGVNLSGLPGDPRLCPWTYEPEGRKLYGAPNYFNLVNWVKPPGAPWEIERSDDRKSVTRGIPPLD